jgi:hypothetical protein
MLESISSLTIQDISMCYCGVVAEREGFEPSVPARGTTVFETAPIDRSGTSPLDALAL